MKDNLTAKKFLESKELLGICKITCKLHENLNYIKGTVFAPCLNNIPEKEIINELSSQGVVDVYKYLKQINGQSSPSGVVLLTFDLYNLPESIDISWYKVKVREYIPNPMRCKKYQLLGHTKNRCQGTEACVNCNLPPHEKTECTRTFCANCAEEHQSSSNKCIKFIQQKEILTIKTKRKCSMREAITIHKEQNKTNISLSSFSAITAKNQGTISTSEKTTTIAPPSPNSYIRRANAIKEKVSAILAKPSITTNQISKNSRKEEDQNSLSLTPTLNLQLLITSKNPDISCLQETKCKGNFTPITPKQYIGYFFNPNTSSKQGSAILIKRNIPHKIINTNQSLNVVGLEINITFWSGILMPGIPYGDLLRRITGAH